MVVEVAGAPGGPGGMAQRAAEETDPLVQQNLAKQPGYKPPKKTMEEICEDVAQAKAAKRSEEKEKYAEAVTLSHTSRMNKGRRTNGLRRTRSPRNRQPRTTRERCPRFRLY